MGAVPRSTSWPGWHLSASEGDAGGGGRDLQHLKDAVKHAVADGKAPGSTRVTATLIAELLQPVQRLLVHAYRAILRGAEVPESWQQAIIWLMPKGTATGDLDAFRPIVLRQQDMIMLMTPLMRRFIAVLSRAPRQRPRYS